MHREPHLRIMRVHEDADEDGEIIVPEPKDPGEAPAEEPDDAVLLRRKYEDRHPWRCGPCNQPMEPEWHRCSMCGLLREDCET